MVERLVLKDQLVEIAFLLIKLPFQDRQIQGHQHLSLAHTLANLGIDTENLPSGTGIENPCIIGINQDPLTVHLRGNRPEDQPKAEQTTDASEGCSQLLMLRKVVPATPELFNAAE